MVLAGGVGTDGERDGGAVLSVVTVLPRLSSTVTWTAGVMVAPAVVVVGWVVNTSWAAAPGVMVKGLLVVVGWGGELVAVRV